MATFIFYLVLGPAILIHQIGCCTIDKKTGRCIVCDFWWGRR